MHLRSFNLIHVFFFILILACSDSTDNDEKNFVSSDRDKFVGNWAGTYECTTLPGDTMIISLGESDFGFDISLHVTRYAFEPVNVTGELTGVNEITIPDQVIGHFTGNGLIEYSNGTLHLTQSGLGITCHGTYTVKF